MKLICEVLEEVQLVTEEKEDGKKDFYIEGVFMQADLKNRNGRIYPMPVMEKEVNRYVKEYVNTKRAFGELGHPEGPQINLDRISHMITELKRDGSNIIGRAKILETPMGNIARNIIQGGGSLGVSSRGMGSLKERNGIMEVQDDFTLATAADIVADPSAPGAFVNGIMEGVEWVWDNGLLKAQQIELYKEEIEKAAAKPNKRVLEEAMLRTWSDFLSKL
ncbi:primosomal protein [bacterium]|nr:primosomal protein [bacterium]